MRKLWIPLLMTLTLLFQSLNLISIEDSNTQIARGGGRGGGGRGGGGRVGGGGRSVSRAAGARSVNRTAVSYRGAGSLQRTPSMTRARAYRAGAAVGAAATSTYGGYSYAQPSYYYPSSPYYYYYYPYSQ